MRHAFYLLMLLLTLNGCSGTKNYPPATDALDATREFLGSCLKGDFEKASAYMVQDDANKKLLKEAEETYRSKTANQQKQYGEASLQNISIEEVSPNATIIYFTYSFDKVARKAKAIQNNKYWLVDFKFTFNPNL